MHRESLLIASSLFALVVTLTAGGASASVAESAPPDENFDVAVYGGTPGGIAAAVAAARAGARTVLLEPKRHVGGLSTSGINTAELEHMLRWTFGGISLEFFERLGRKYGKSEPVFFSESSVAEQVFKEMLGEAKVSVRFGERVERAEKTGARIRRLVMSGGAAIGARVFIDATYEGDLMARAGVSYTWGRESTHEYKESLAGIRLDSNPRRATPYDQAGKLLPGVSLAAKELAPGAGDRKVMNYNFRLSFTKNPANQAPIPPPTDYNSRRYALLQRFIAGETAAGRKIVLTDILDFYNRPNGKYEVNNKQRAIISIGHFGGQFDYPNATYAEQDAIYEDHRQYTLGLLYFLANDASVPAGLRTEMRAWGLSKDEFADNGNFPYYLYIREARRLKGAYVMTQRDVQDDRRKPDSIGMSSHFIDAHHVQRVAVSLTEFANEGRIWRAGYACQIPYRALTPRQNECDNLLVPVAASFSHVAFCTYRLESVWMVGGHATGLAAAQAAKNNQAVQRVDVAGLQTELTRQGQVLNFQPGQPEKFEGKISPPEF